jgi:hypothetical protein
MNVILGLFFSATLGPDDILIDTRILQNVTFVNYFQQSEIISKSDITLYVTVEEINRTFGQDFIVTDFRQSVFYDILYFYKNIKLYEIL